MPPTRCLHLFALVALVAVATQLPTRLIELVAAAGDVLFSLSMGVVLCMASIHLLAFLWSPVAPLLTVAGYCMFFAASGLIAVTDSRFRNVGYLPSLVDELLRDEELRSSLQEVYIKLRDEYRKQRSVLASLNHGITKVCKEHNNHCREFPTVFSRIFRPDVPAAPFQDAEWTEPHALVKIGKPCAPRPGEKPVPTIKERCVLSLVPRHTRRQASEPPGLPV
ncbi:predicted protein [Chaetomium globosum CBS 148.51]|uniref:MARVEL domain-containing protein n=1 Tax=Chaetomium globosum (strain ATCC 6205 / CBS 148.51 / DSM 1962 / NBRC 6347 / NRRL 1970) TaxID=306901 RepID=Q2HH10_CHAGB|nr:uncharacterized protein CHGG_00494 [Chaetomium globosum CBS 148.51]EAQ92259.1 predicted protein [Chaetomium globosum CBS 148.51]